MEGSVLICLFLGVGFLLSSSVSQDCGGVLTDLSGDITSPNHPDSYPPNSNCHWEIRVPTTKKIIVIFNHFDLEKTVDCYPGDFLVITDPKGNSSVFCGQDHPWVVESVENSLFVTFVSDSDDQQGLKFGLTYFAASRCEAGWHEFGEHCYFFSEEELTFYEAQMDCEARNAQITSIHSREEQLFVQEKSRTPTVWIGANNTGLLNENPLAFEFIDGTMEDFQNMWSWEVYSPLGSCASGCGILLVPDRWENRDCSETRPVICESAQSHGEDWSCDGDPAVCLHVSTRNFDFGSARSYCQEFPAADMLSIGDNELKQVLMTYAFEYDGLLPRPLPKSREFWIGLRRGVSKDWDWVDGSTFTMDRWEFGNPVEDGGDCAVTATSSWDDIEDGQIGSYICKKTP